MLCPCHWCSSRTCAVQTTVTVGVRKHYSSHLLLYCVCNVLSLSYTSSDHCDGTSREPQDFEEGEIRAADLDMKRSHAAHWSLNWALYESLHGQGPKALSALRAALQTAEGNMQVCPFTNQCICKASPCCQQLCTPVCCTCFWSVMTSMSDDTSVFSLQW